MHHIHHTDAFVISSRAVGEDSKILALYTRELGLVRARAQGIRKLSSKLRFVLQDFSHVQVDLVHGCEGWRVTTAVPIESPEPASSPQGDRILARMSVLIMRMCQGEEANPEVFRALENAYELLHAQDISKNEFAPIELLSVARLLCALGYLSEESIFGLQSNTFAKSVPSEFLDPSFQRSLIRNINSALSASQL